MEEQSQSALPAIARGHNVVHLLPADWTAIPPALSQTLERVDVQAGSTQVLILVADAEAAMGVTKALIDATDDMPRIVPVTGSARAARVLRAGAAPVVVGAPSQILALIAASALKLDGLRTVVVAWAEEILDAGGSRDLDAILADVPKDAYRVVITAELSMTVEDLIERHARRAPRLGVAPAGSGDSPSKSAEHALGSRIGGVAASPADSGLPMTVGYVLSAPAARAPTLRQLIDEIDPPSAAVYVRSDESEREAGATLRILGYHGASAPMRVVRGGGAAAEHTALLVLYDLPLDSREWRAAVAGSPARVIAEIMPRQLPHLRRVTQAVTKPVSLAGSVATAHTREDALRAELRQVLANGAPTRELLALEPLLDEFDGAALGAAALRLLERERGARAAASPAVTPQATTVGFSQPGGRLADARPDRHGATPSRGGQERRDRGRGERPRGGRPPPGPQSPGTGPPRRDKTPTTGTAVGVAVGITPRAVRRGGASIQIGDRPYQEPT